MRAIGHVDPRFARVVEAFEANFEHGEIGAACCLYYRGKPVVDVHGGIADPVTGRAWDDRTAALVFSTTKGITAVCVHRLVERGELDVDAPVARYWPEFAARGKEAITLRQVLSHRAGLAEVDGDHLTLADVVAWHPVVEAIARQAPIWEPGTAHGYHARAYGWIVGEVIRRVTGRMPGRFFAEEIAEPLGVDFWIGLPESEEPRLARIVPPESPTDPKVRDLLGEMMGPNTLLGRVMSGPANLFAYDDRWNERPLHAAEMPSSNGIGTAHAIARTYAAAIGEVDGIRLLAPETLAAACVEQSRGTDKVLMLPTAFGLGFMLTPTLCPSAPPTAFGHPGAGGSLGIADPAAGFALGYVMNRMNLGVTGDSRALSLVEATYACLP